MFLNKSNPFSIHDLIDAPMRDDCGYHPSKGGALCAHCGYAIKRADLIRLPEGTPIAGLAPIGIRWSAVISRGKIRPDRGCPASEFAPTYARVPGIPYPVPVVD